MWGVVLLTAPRGVLGVIGTPATPGVVGLTRVLGARHLLQGLVLVLAHHPPLRVTAGVEAVHAATMIAAAVVPRYRRAALVSAVVAAGLAAGSWTAHDRGVTG